MPYEWDTSLETHNPAIDNQHKQLILMLNKLIAAHKTGKSAAELEITLEFMAAYTIKHFNDEEALQKQYDYPDYLYHKHYHQEFKTVVGGLINRLKEEGYSHCLVEHTIDIIADWLINHIKGDDFKLAAHIQALHITAQNQPVA